MLNYTPVYFGITSNVLKGLADFLLPIVGIGLIIFMVVMAMRVKNGSSSMKEMAVGAVAFILIGGVILFASVNFANTSSGTNTAVKKAVDNAAKQAANNADGILSGNGK